MLRLGVSSGAFYPRIETEEVPAVATSYGFRDVELMVQTVGEYQPSFIREVRTRVDAAGCRVHGIHSFQTLHRFQTPYVRRKEEAYALFALGIDATVALGGSVIVWHGFTKQDVAAPGGWDDFFRVTSQLSSMCAEAGVTLAIENVSWCALNSVRDVLNLAARLPELGPHGSIGFAFDPFQAAEAGANPFMILNAMEGAIVDVHLSDHQSGDEATRHLLPGDGALPWPALIRAIAATGYAGPMMIEGAIPNAETAARVVRLLDPLIADAISEDDPCFGTPPAGVLEGIRLFNERKFYEAHEELEHEWHAERRPLRKLYQGILQIGVGFHHARGGNHKGALLLLTDGIDKVSGFVPSCQGIDTARLVRESQVCLDRIIELGAANLSDFNWEFVPLVNVTSQTSQTIA